jgi:hypothetical protein
MTPNFNNSTNIPFILVKKKKINTFYLFILYEFELKKEDNIRNLYLFYYLDLFFKNKKKKKKKG